MPETNLKHTKTASIYLSSLTEQAERYKGHPVIPAKSTASVELAENTNIVSSGQELNNEEPKLPYNNITGGLHASRSKISSMELKDESKVGPRVNELRVLMTKRYRAQIEGKALQDLRI